MRTLRQTIDGMLYERTALPKKPDQLIPHELAVVQAEDKLTPDLVFQDPCVLAAPLFGRKSVTFLLANPPSFERFAGASSQWPPRRP